MRNHLLISKLSSVDVVKTLWPNQSDTSHSISQIEVIPKNIHLGCFWLCFIQPMLGIRYGSGVSWRRAMTPFYQ